MKVALNTRISASFICSHISSLDLHILWFLVPAISNSFSSFYFVPFLQKHSANLVPVATTFRNLRALAQAVALGCPVIVQGEEGCGKSFFIRELAAAVGQSGPRGGNLVELSLDEQTDCKTLFGSYICTDVPGEFRWQQGIVTQAALAGDWLVIEGEWCKNKLFQLQTES